MWAAAWVNYCSLWHNTNSHTTSSVPHNFSLLHISTSQTTLNPSIPDVDPLTIFKLSQGVPLDNITSKHQPAILRPEIKCHWSTQFAFPCLLLQEYYALGLIRDCYHGFIDLTSPLSKPDKLSQSQSTQCPSLWEHCIHSSQDTGQQSRG